MNSHLLTQEERDYFINLYREYGIKDLGIVDYGMVRLESYLAMELGVNGADKLSEIMEKILIRLEFHFEIVMSEINGEVDIDLRIYGNGIRVIDKEIYIFFNIMIKKQKVFCLLFFIFFVFCFSISSYRFFSAWSNLKNKETPEDRPRIGFR